MIFRPSAKALISSFILALSLPAPAALAAAGDSGIIYYSPGIQFLNPAPLNSSLTPQGYKALDGFFWSQGGGLMLSYRRFMLGAEFHALSGQLTQSGSESLNMEASYGLFQLGYIAASSNRFQVYPYVGIGPGLATLHSSQPLNGLLNMSQGSNDRLQMAQGLSWLLDLGAGGNFIIPMSPDNAEDQRGLVLGLRLGYLLPLGGTSWQSNRLPVSGGPDLNPGGFYTRLSLGFGAAE